jgi:DNA-binding Lrp family transcriptional regulator
MGTVFVFDPDASYGRVQEIREAKFMPAGVHLVASVTGPWKILSIVDYSDLREDFTGRVEGLAGGGGFGDPETAVVIGFSKVKRSVYANQMAFVRIETRVPDPRELIGDIEEAIGSDEIDVVAGDFDILACAVADDDDSLASKIFAVRTIEGVKRTKSLRVIDFVSESEDAPDGHRVSA